jgi:hypothetical protein
MMTRPRPPASGTDRAICLSTAAAVLAVAGIAAYSYGHACAVIRAHGQTGITARLEPATIVGLLYASSMLIVHAARHGSPVPGLARWLPGLGIAATLTANAAQGWSHGPAGVVIAAWPAASLEGAHELLIWLVRTCGTVQRGPSAGPARPGAACRAVVRAAPAAAAWQGRHPRPGDYPAAVRFFGETLGPEAAFGEGNTVEPAAGNGNKIQRFGPGHHHFDFPPRPGRP